MWTEIPTKERALSSVVMLISGQRMCMLTFVWTLPGDKDRDIHIVWEPSHTCMLFLQQIPLRKLKPMWTASPICTCTWDETCSMHVHAPSWTSLGALSDISHTCSHYIIATPTILFLLLKITSVCKCVCLYMTACCLNITTTVQSVPCTLWMCMTNVPR